ncbi:MAG: PorV/PorQ family protein [Bacteroidales bacterium]|nr:PorV/PorQ family protein [Bacteroidales bacterium]
MRKGTFYIVILLLFFSRAMSQTAKYSNAFLSLGIGARGLSMSNSMTAIVDDITAAYWNPAGLVNMNKKYEVGLMHAEYFAGIAKYDYGAIAYKIDERSAVSLSYIRFGVDNIMNTTDLIDNQGNINYDRISYFSAADHAFFVTYSRQMPRVEGLSLGGSVKIIRRTIGHFAGAWGFGLDAGLRFHRKGWQAGCLLRDATSTFNAWSYHLTDREQEVFLLTGNELPVNGLELTTPTLLLGGAKQVNFGKGFNATFALDFDCTFDGKRNVLIRSNFMSIDPHFGMEFAYKKIVAVRAGLGQLQQETDFDNKKKTTVQVNLGVGLCIKNIVTIDYAFTDIGDLSIAMYSHIFSLKIGLNTFKRTNNLKIKTTD